MEVADEEPSSSKSSDSREKSVRKDGIRVRARRKRRRHAGRGNQRAPTHCSTNFFCTMPSYLGVVERISPILVLPAAVVELEIKLARE